MGDLQLNFFLNLSGHLVTRPLKLQFNSIFCFAPPQFSEEILWIYSARLDETLVTCRSIPTFVRQKLRAIGATHHIELRPRSGDSG